MDIRAAFAVLALIFASAAGYSISHPKAATAAAQFGPVGAPTPQPANGR
jgi:hypothetical protein